MVYFHCCKGTLLTPVQLVHQDPQLLLCKPASNQSGPNQFCCMGLFLPRCQSLHCLPWTSWSFCRCISPFCQYSYEWQPCLSVDQQLPPICELWAFFFICSITFPWTNFRKTILQFPRSSFYPSWRWMWSLSFSVIKTSPDTTAFQRWEVSLQSLQAL